MLTTQFKASVAVLTGVVILGGVVLNQVSLQRKVAELEQETATKTITLPLPSLTPVASPTAQLSPAKTTVFPTKPFITVAPTVVK